MKYKLHIPFGSRTDLLRKAVESARDIGNINLWADGVDCPRDIPDVTIHEPGLVTIVSLINMCLKSSWEDDVCFLMHNDAEAKPGVAKQFIDYVTGLVEREPDRKWGVAFTHYDTLCAFNMKAIHACGYWDTMYFQYTADTDYYRTLKVSGWEVIDWPNGHVFRDGVVHHGSSSIKSDRLHAHKVRFINRTNFTKGYYILKWGGPEGHEMWKRPFNGLFGGRNV